MIRRSFCSSLLAVILAATCLQAGTKRILLVGDSWMAGTWLSKAGDKALAANGLGRFETEGEMTAIGGSRADQWASNQKGKLDALHAELRKYPTIDIVHLCIGGNDFLRFANSTDLAKLSPDARAAQWKIIRADIQKVVDDILAQRTNIRVVISDYDYLDPGRMSKVYKFSFSGVGAQVFNEAFVELGRQKLEIAKHTPRCYYVQNWGLLQYRYGVAPDLKPGQVRLPGGPPGYDPYPGGDPRYSSGDAMPDGVHPTPEGFQYIFENAVKQYYAQWLRR